MFGFNKKKNLENLKEFYRSINLSPDSFVLFNINKNYIKSSQISREIDFLKGSDTFGLRAGIFGIKIYQEAFKNTTILYQNEIVMAPEVQQNFNQLIDEMVLFSINHFTKTLNKPMEASSLNAASEEKALEWLRVSLKVLTESHIDLLKKNESAPSYSLYFGLNPKTSLYEFRIAIFNLDINYQLLKDNNLRIVVYNNHGQTLTTQMAPSLKGDFSIRKREMFNLLIELLNELKKSYRV